MHNVISYDKLVEKWAPVLESEAAGTIQDAHRKAVTAAVLENQEHALKEEGMLPPLKAGDELDLDHMKAQETFSRPPARYTEASLVKKMEEIISNLKLLTSKK